MDDYGYFGEGITGYVHYTEAMKRNSGGGGGGGGNGGGGCGSTLIAILVVLGVLYMIGSCAGA